MTEKPKSKVPVKGPKKPSFIATALTPQFGGSIRPMGQAFSAFVHIIAVIFAMNGLFPKNHPALKDDSEMHLSLSLVLRTAWKDLKFTPEGLPKVLLFFAVSGGIVLILLSVVTALALGFTGHAHADTGVTAASASTFTPGSNDLAANWITYLFGTSSQSSAALTSITSTLGPNASMPTTTVQAALISALATYSDAILVIAAIILFYHLTAMVVETAHHGVPMGKRANQIWAPIRLVVAIGLLVPVNGGLNCGQLIVVQIAKMGSGLASTVWKGFATTLANDSGQLASLPPAADASGIVEGVELMYACEYAFNFEVAKAFNGYNSPGGAYVKDWALNLSSATTPPPVVPMGGAGTYSFNNGIIADNNLCGSVTIPAEPTISLGNNVNLQPVADTIYNGIKSAFAAVNSGAPAVGAKMQTFVHGFDITDNGSPPNYIWKPNLSLTLSSDDISSLATPFQNAINSAITSAAQNTNLQSAMQNIATNSANEGWIAAGAWFNTLASAQNALSGVAQNSMPIITMPAILDGTDNRKSLGGNISGFFNRISNFGDGPNENSQQIFMAVINNLSNYKNQLEKDPGTTTTTTTTPIATVGATGNNTGINCSPADPLVCILGIVNSQAEQHGVWNPSAGTNQLALGVQFSAANPIMAIAGYGQKCVQTAVDEINTGIWSAALGVGTKIIAAAGKVAGAIPGRIGLIGKGVEALFSLLGAACFLIATFFFFLGSMFFTLGVVLGYVIPLLPFIHFFFNSITWVSCVAESIVAIPLVALAHLNPEGDGLPGQKAAGAYTMIFSVFLRPVLMVFGLICGLLIMYVAAGLLNALYASVVAGASSGTGNATVNDSHMVISRIMFTVMYVVILFSIANHAFALIGHFPNKAMEWMGSKGLSGEKMGEPGHIAQYTGVAAGYISNQGLNKLESGMQSGGSSVDRLGDAGQGAMKHKMDHDEENRQKEMRKAGFDDGMNGNPPHEKLRYDPTYQSSYKAGQVQHDRNARSGNMMLSGPSGDSGGDDAPSPNNSGGGDSPDSSDKGSSFDSSAIKNSADQAKTSADEAKSTADRAEGKTDELRGRMDNGSGPTPATGKSFDDPSNSKGAFGKRPV